MKTHHFNIDAPQLLNEIADCALPHSAGVLKIPLNIFRTKLGILAQRAIELNDPQLNIIMLEMRLYDVHPKEIQKAIEVQQKRIKPKKLLA